MTLAWSGRCDLWTHVHIIYWQNTSTLTSKTSSSIDSEVIQLCLTLCDPMDCSLLGSSVYGIFQVRVLEWVAISFSRGSSQPRDWTWVPCIVGRCFTIWATREVRSLLMNYCFDICSWYSTLRNNFLFEYYIYWIKSYFCMFKCWNLVKWNNYSIAITSASEYWTVTITIQPFT